MGVWVIGFYALLAWLAVRKIRQSRQDSEPEEPETEPDPDPYDFRLMNLKEKTAAAKQAADAAGELENLLTDLQTTGQNEYIKAVDLCWTDHDGRHTCTIYCAGDDAETDAVMLLVKRQVHAQRKLLAMLCRELEMNTRHVQNGVQISPRAGDRIQW